ncbi:hypothetical protein [Tuwongella immobilis]|uniref:Parg family protein n=1 Tax=Tuwongella immobilis TaxID=692036 RepID=A0A6C2YWW2_9BACT|nr:hypothetical protein [Tuwongella immobilis]VIP05315.1 parg family protein : [Tuwongella immobilis]VTS07986.1 parg family protein : [Tuwongella immobilis]
MTKKITFPHKSKTPPPAADAWVAEPSHPPETRSPAKPVALARMRKLTVDVPDDLYRRVRVGLAREDRNLTELVNEFLAARFPEI